MAIQQNVHHLVIAVKDFGYSLSKKTTIKSMAKKLHRNQLIHGLKSLMIDVRTEIIVKLLKIQGKDIEVYRER